MSEFTCWSASTARFSRLLFLVLVGALASLHTPSPASAASRAEACREVRDDPCDARYDPVCARWDTGIRCVRAPCPSVEERLYTNACLACQDDQVVGFERGECAEPPELPTGRRYRVQLDAFIGKHTQKDRPRVAKVDLGVPAPIEVARAWIWIEGEATPGSAESLDPALGVVEMQVDLQIAMQDSFDSNVFSLARPVTRLGPFEGFFKAHGRFGVPHRLQKVSWETLLDGRTELQLAFTRVCPDAGCRYLEDAVVSIRRAELVVDALAAEERPSPR